MFKQAMLSVALMTAVGLSAVAVASPAQAKTTAQSTKVKTQAELEQFLKQQQVPMDRLEKSSINGIYHIIYQDQMAFVDDTGSYLILGEVYDIADVKKQVGEISYRNVSNLANSNLSYASTMGQLAILSQDKKTMFWGDIEVIRLSDMMYMTDTLNTQASRVEWLELDLKDAIKSVKGNGSRKIAVFSDPLCPFCRALEKNLQQVNNVTIYTFLIPYKPNAEPLAKRVWCDTNPQYTWHNLMIKNITPTSNKECATPFQRNLALADKLGINGTPAIILSDGTKLSGSRSAKELEEALKSVAK